MGDDAAKPSSAFEKACKVCSGFGDMFKQVNGRDKPAPKPKAASSQPPPTSTVPTPPPPVQAAEPAAAAAAAAAAATPHFDNETYSRHSTECPEDYLSLGSKSWSFLHTVAAYYKPESSKDAGDMAQFLKLVGKFYPCRDCGEHLE
jgi:FAD-linked sulfhydryl oxidase